jgi:uncharacterized membrane protein YphA (DoxX/SURF4 family)
MNILTGFGQFYYEAKRNKWFGYFTVFCRVVLSIGFIPSGIVKIMGERFTALPVNHPLGHYFEALHLTGYYYTFIGVIQLTAAILLLIPRSALLGALIYFPIILNICILAYAVRFEGTRITTLMLLANIYLLSWDYDRLKSILPFKQSTEDSYTTNEKASISKFPFLFFGCVFAIIASIIVINHFLYDIRPGNSLLECRNSCSDRACEDFCACIYNEGKPLHNCLDEYEKAKQPEK